MEQKRLEIRLIARQVKAGNGRDFTAFKAVQKDGTLIDTKFTRACPNTPTDSCTIIVNASDCNVTKNTLYPTLWVKAVVEIIDKDGSKLTEKQEKELAEMFG